MRLYWRLSRFFVKTVMRVLFGFRAFGAEKVPLKGGLLLACNHQSFLDPPLVGLGPERELYYLAKEGLFQQNRFFSWLITRYHAVPLRREGGDFRAIRTTLRLVAEGKAVVIFPEGTRSKTGKLLRAKPGIGLLMMKANVPIIPCFLRGSNKALKELFLRREKLHLSFGDPIGPGLFTEERDGRARAQAISDEVMRRIGALGEQNEGLGSPLFS